MNDALLRFMGLARRAGKLSLGSDPAAEALNKGSAQLILLAGDLSPRTAGGIESAAKEKGVAVVKTGVTMDEISMAIGKRAGVVAVNDRGFAEKLTALCADERGGI